MKYTVLDMTQTVLSRLDSEEVNSIGDNEEARQVATIIRTSYYNILTRLNMPKHKSVFTLVGTTDVATPTLMTVPDNVVNIEWIKYKDTDATSGDSYGYVTILPMRQFLEYVNGFNNTDTNVGSMTINGTTFYYTNDTQPFYCTIMSNNDVIFDSYDNTKDTTLQSSKTQCFGLTSPSFELSDSHIPDLDDHLFPLLLNEATSAAFLELKQIQHPIADRDSKRNWASAQKKQITNPENPSAFDLLPYFGRR